jgi:hypothetical protein
LCAPSIFPSNASELLGRQCAAAKQHRWLDEYVAKIAAEVRKVLEPA